MDLKLLARYGAQARIAELEQEIANIRKAFPGLTASPKSVSRRGRKASAATRAKMRAAWAKRKAASGQAQPGPASAPAGPKRKRRTISAAGRARIAAAQKARWAKVKAGKKR